MRDVELNIGTKTRDGRQLLTGQIVSVVKDLFVNVSIRWDEGEDEGIAVVRARLPFGAQPMTQLTILCRRLEQTAIAAWFLPCSTQPRGYGVVQYQTPAYYEERAYGLFDPEMFMRY